MKKTRVYIDGYNLYYGLLKGTSWKWLDLELFSKGLLNPDHEIVSIVYFTAPVKTHPHDPAALDRQKIYLQGLSKNPLIKTVLGYYTKNDTLLPFSDERCGQCDVVKDGFVPVKKLEEKRSDVNIAVAMLLDAVRTDTESFVLITGDSDQVGAIEALRYELGKSVLVFNPHPGLSQHLKRAASYYKNIPRDLSAKCQLPDEIPVGTHGNVVRRPEAWK